ncbi:MAG: HEPN domain-containing protein [Gammaproteobacteria bacterium]|nr:HEPN domain-containing protein [Gammaproteobacteria bacterium]
MTSPLVLGFLKAAERDIAGIERLLPDLPDLAAFHAQQAVEKLARAVRLHEGLPDLRTHDITRITEQLAQEHPLRKSFIKLGSLTGAATAWRYPDAAGKFPKTPEPREIQAALKQIKSTEAEIRDWLSAPRSSSANL